MNGPILEQMPGFLTKPNCSAISQTPLPANTYAAGPPGVLTATANGAFPTIDGVAPALNQRYVVNGEAVQSHNGIYILTQVGTAGTPYILTRAPDFASTDIIQDGAIVFVDGNGTLPTVGGNGKAYWTGRNQTLDVSAIVWTNETKATVPHQDLVTMPGGGFPLRVTTTVVNAFAVAPDQGLATVMVGGLVASPGLDYTSPIVGRNCSWLGRTAVIQTAEVYLNYTVTS